VAKIFYSLLQSTNDVYTTDLTGANTQRIVTNAGIYSPPRGTQVLVVRTVGDSLQFLLTDPWGINTRLLFSKPYAAYRALSPNAKLIAYDVITQTGHWMKVQNLSSNSESIIIDSTEYPSNNTPVFSPDSKKILFAVLVGTVFKLAISNVDGTNRKIITDTASVAISPSEIFPHPYDWSPDGTKIIYYASTSTPEVNSFTIIDIQSGEKTIISTDTMWHREINWSPNGRYLLYYIRRYIQDIKNGDQTIETLFLYDLQAKTSKRFDVPYKLPSGVCPVYQWTPDEKNIILSTSEWNGNSNQSKYEAFLLDISSGTFIPLDLPIHQIDKFYVGQSLLP
jgi:Tol biopolymer transport system component